jgi:hypothetical protein
MEASPDSFFTTNVVTVPVQQRASAIVRWRRRRPMTKFQDRDAIHVKRQFDIDIMFWACAGITSPSMCLHRRTAEVSRTLTHGAPTSAEIG